MAENSKIEWTTHTFNPWIGCAKVHTGCTHCYAEELMDKRYGKASWGANGTRVLTSPSSWDKPFKWDRDAAKAGIRPRVFCASLADVFEDWAGPITHHAGGVYVIDERGMKSQMSAASYPDPPRLGSTTLPNQRWMTLSDARRNLFRLIDATPNLDWLLLTKRPENVLRMWPCTRDTDGDGDCPACSHGSLLCKWRPNVWVGTSISDRPTASKALPELRKIRDLCPVLFLSGEPIVGPIELDLSGIDWVIAGGESGHGARPCHPDWIRSLRDQCQASHVAFFFKQWGEWQPLENAALQPAGPNGEVHSSHASFIEGSPVVRVGKKEAGADLDDRLWREFPVVVT